MVAWSGGGVLVVIDHAAALDRLPGRNTNDPFERLAAAFLVGYPPNSARAYGSDLRAWWQWCVDAGVHPFDARRHHVDAWVREMSTSVTSSRAPARRPLKPASIRRRLSAVSKFYRYGIEVEVLTHSPVDQVRRPKASAETKLDRPLPS